MLKRSLALVSLVAAMTLASSASIASPKEEAGSITVTTVAEPPRRGRYRPADAARGDGRGGARGRHGHLHRPISVALSLIQSSNDPTASCVVNLAVHDKKKGIILAPPRGLGAGLGVCEGRSARADRAPRAHERDEPRARRRHRGALNDVRRLGRRGRHALRMASRKRTVRGYNEPVVRLALVITVLAAGCAAVPRPAPPRPAPEPPAPVDVAPVAPPPAVDTTALKEKADLAVTAAAKKLEDIKAICHAEWLETEAACHASDFESFAKDYQGYYDERPDPRRETGTYYALPRLGGPTRTVEQVVSDSFTTGCEDFCRTERNTSINVALEDASKVCMKAGSGFAACKALGKKLAKNVRASEVERWRGPARLAARTTARRSVTPPRSTPGARAPRRRPRRA